MMNEYQYDETFDKLNALPGPGEYESCTFTNCQLSSADLSAYRFSDCVFDTCDLSLVQLNGTGLRSIQFQHSKLIGIRFDDVNKLGLDLNFHSCQLENSSFFELDLKGIQVKSCNLQHVDFSGAKLIQAIFDYCDLLHSTFEQTDLTQADFSTSYNLDLNPVLNQVKNLKISQADAASLLSHLGIQVPN